MDKPYWKKYVDEQKVITASSLKVVHDKKEKISNNLAIPYEERQKQVDECEESISKLNKKWLS